MDRIIVKYSTRGGALYFAILVVSLLSLISMGFILLQRLWMHEEILFQKTIELNDNIDSAIEVMKNTPELVMVNETRDIAPFNDERLVTTSVKRWGMLRLISFTASWKNSIFKRSVLFSETDNEKLALYLTDNNKFLSLVGGCEIKGDCFLPALGIRAGEIDGRTFTGKHLINGKIMRSHENLPEIQLSKIIPWFNYIEKQYNLTDSIVNITQLLRKVNANVSFDSNTLVVDCGKNLILQNIQLSGNIVLVATDSITILPSAVLHDVIIASPIVNVTDNVIGNFQIFARRKVTLGKNCRLSYPSFVICCSQRDTSNIMMGENSVVSGGILIDSFSENRHNNRLLTADGCELTGTVYVDGAVGFNGRLDGSLYCSSFIIETPRAYYENFLSNVIIDSQSPPAYFGSFTFDETPELLKYIKLCL